MIISKLFKKIFFYILIMFFVMVVMSTLYSTFILRKDMINEYISKAHAIANSISMSLPEVFLNADASVIQSIIDQYLEVEGVGYVLVHDDKGNILAHTFVPFVPQIMKYHHDNIHNIQTSDSYSFIDIDNKRYIDISRPILAGKACILHIGMKMDVINKKIFLSLLKIQICNLMIFVLTIFIIYKLINKLSFPLLHLTDYAHKLSRKEFDANVQIETDDEIGDLARTMKNMANELKRYIEELYREKEFFTVTLKSIADGVITTDKNRVIQFVNRQAEKMLALDDDSIKGNIFSDVVNLSTEVNKSLVEQAINKAQIVEIEQTVLKAHNGNQIPVSCRVAPIYDRTSHVLGAVAILRDISDDLHREIERTKAEKLDALGILAGGIAHDFNNRLTVIMNLVELIRRTATLPHQVEKRLEGIYKTALKARDLAKQLLTFARGGAPIKEVSTLQNLIKDVTEFVLAGSNIIYELNLPDDLWLVEIDESQIAQVFENLLVNAKQAMPGGGTIIINAKNFEYRKNNSLLLPLGKYVRISIMDTGPGIPEENLTKIFDPYFTTKTGGSGLGLATVYSIIKKHDGLIDVTSRVGQGTCFTIYLPATEKQPEQKVQSSIYHVDQDSSLRILVMDDEEEILEVVSDTLEFLGHTCMTARDGQEMLHIYQKAMKRGEVFDAVIMDMTVPGGMGGKEAIQKLLQIDPDAVAIASSGYSHDDVIANYKKYGFKAVLNKPYTMDELARILNVIRGGGGRQTGI